MVVRTWVEESKKLAGNFLIPKVGPGAKFSHEIFHVISLAGELQFTGRQAFATTD